MKVAVLSFWRAAWFGRYFCAARRCRVFAPAGESLSLAANESNQSKAALLPASPSLRYGATCGARAWAAPRNALRAARYGQTDAVSQITKFGRSTAPKHSPRSVRLGAGKRGGGGIASLTNYCFDSC